MVLTDEEAIVDFINKQPLTKDRYLLIEYISKLSNSGLYIESIDQLYNYIQEAILFKYIDNETNEDYVAKWYWNENVKFGEDPWKPFDFSTCKILEKALKYDIPTVRINSPYYVDIESLSRKRYDSSSKRKVKREKAKLEKPYNSDNDNATTTTIIEDSNLQFIQWYWADDGPKGIQKEWKKYSEELCTKLERQFKNKGNERIKVDNDRYVDTKSMLQIRYDNKSHTRMVKREEKSIIQSPILVLTHEQAIFLLRKLKTSINASSIDDNDDQIVTEQSALFTHTLNTFRNVLSRNNFLLKK